jgi:hypothetical protein
MLMEDDRDDATWAEEAEEGQTAIDSVSTACSAIERFSADLGEKTLLPALHPIIAELRAGATPQ